MRTAFKLSYELKDLSHIENEFRSGRVKNVENPKQLVISSLKNVILKDYEFLSGQCEIFAKELLDQARSSEELSTILYYSDESDAISQDGILGEPCPMRTVSHCP